MKTSRFLLTLSAILFLTVELALSQTITTDELHKIGIAPSAERIEKDIQTLVDFGTRHTLSDTVSSTEELAPQEDGSKLSSNVFRKIVVDVSKYFM